MVLNRVGALSDTATELALNSRGTTTIGVRTLTTLVDDRQIFVLAIRYDTKSES